VPRGWVHSRNCQHEGTIDNATQSITATASGTHRPTNCGVRAHGKTFFISGVFQSAASVHVVNGFPKGVNTASLTGEFDWRTANGRRSGHCVVDYDAKANYDANTAEVTGNFCGTEIRISGPLTT
jgi:hypothetical protein